MPTTKGEQLYTRPAGDEFMGIATNALYCS